jgi:hypothetical protein
MIDSFLVAGSETDSQQEYWLVESVCLSNYSCMLIPPLPNSTLHVPDLSYQSLRGDVIAITSAAEKKRDHEKIFSMARPYGPQVALCINTADLDVDCAFDSCHNNQFSNY